MFTATAVHFKAGQYQLEQAHRWLKLVRFLIGQNRGWGKFTVLLFTSAKPQRSNYEAIILVAN